MGSSRLAGYDPHPLRQFVFWRKFVSYRFSWARVLEDLVAFLVQLELQRRIYREDDYQFHETRRAVSSTFLNYMTRKHHDICIR